MVENIINYTYILGQSSVIFFNTLEMEKHLKKYKYLRATINIA